MSTNRPARPGRPARPARSSGLRGPVEQRSAVALGYLRRLPAWLPALAIAALFIAGLAVPGWGGAAALCAVAAFLGWLAFLSWPRLGGAGRFGRAGAIALVLALAVLQATR
jgi:hypothetical protein